MKTGEIIDFSVTARCPHCTEITAVNDGELRSKEAVCQHCDESFSVELDIYDLKLC
ncbi:hypothetical protein ACRN9C_20765 [Shewanella frigidimarina]|uniref:hypothetical protein n=1 Tax=Shewanella frigidimarina TaxID=56812 RepID=UPI003D7901F3